MIENIIALLVITSILTTAKNDRVIGNLVVFHYLLYMVIEASEFSFTIGNVYIDFELSSHWYLFCCCYSLSFFMASCYLFINKKGVIVLYAIWLLFDAICCGLMAISQSFETNALLNVYNDLQDISLFVDLTLVLLSTDHIIKRKFHSAAAFINSINDSVERWCNMVPDTILKGKACLTKK
jgi:hypothetical protein